MATRRSRLQIKPNIGPKPVRGVTKPETRQTEEPKKADTLEKEQPIKTPDQTTEKKTPSEKKQDADSVKVSSPEKKTEISADLTDSATRLETEINESKSLNSKTVNESKEPTNDKKPDTRPKLRNRFPKAKPNLANIGRPERKPVQPKTPTTPKPDTVTEIYTPNVVAPSDNSDITDKENVIEEIAPSNKEVSSTGSTEIIKLKSPKAVAKETLSSSEDESVFDDTDRPVEKSIFDKPVMPILRPDKIRPLRKSLGSKKKRQLPSIDEPPDRSKMRMIDLIYWNPSSNPMKRKNVPEKPKELPKSMSGLVAASDEEIQVDKPDIAQDEDSNMSNALPVPQVTIGPDGNIVINQTSLVVDNKIGEDPIEAEVIEEDESTVNYTSFREKRSKSSWSELETKKFYKALSTVGTDFSLMLNLFPRRTRQEIKNKFKKEERHNRAEVDKAIRNRTLFDMTDFEKFEEEVAEEERLKAERALAKKTEKTDKTKQKGRKRKTQHEEVKENKVARKRKKKKRKSKALISDDDEDNNEEVDDSAESWMSDEEEEEEPLSKSLSDKEVVDILVDLGQSGRPLPRCEDDVSDAESEAPSEATSVASESVFVPKNVRPILSSRIRKTNIEEDRTVDNQILSDSLPSGNIGHLVSNVISNPCANTKTLSSTQTSVKEDEASTVSQNGETKVSQVSTPTSVPPDSSRVVTSDIQHMDIPESLLPVINSAGGADKVQIVLVHDTDGVSGQTVVHVYILPKTAEELSIGGSTVQLTPTKNKCLTSEQEVKVSQCSTMSQHSQGSSSAASNLSQSALTVTKCSSTLPNVPPSPITPFQRLSSRSVTLAQTAADSGVKVVPSTAASLPPSSLLTPGLTNAWSDDQDTTPLTTLPLTTTSLSIPSVSRVCLFKEDTISSCDPVNLTVKKEG